MGGRASKGEAQLQKYKQCSVIGTGAFGIVVAGKEKRPDKKHKGELVALKFQCLKTLLKDVSHAKDAKRELDLLKELQTTGSPFVMKLKAAFVTKKHLVLVMPLLLGGDLRYHLREYGRFEVQRTRILIGEVICGLEAIHSLDVVYRDLKPENVVLTAEGHARITDFDRSRHIHEDTDEGDELMEFTGTVGYMAPELINIEKYDQCIDVWSLGVLFYELLNCKLPFGTEVCYKSHVDAKNFPCPEFHHRLSKEPDTKSIILRLLTFEVKKRIGCEDEKGGVNWDRIRQHDFFAPIDWKKLTNEEIDPPKLPTLEDRVLGIREACAKRKSKEGMPNAEALTEKEKNMAKEIFGSYCYLKGHPHLGIPSNATSKKASRSGSVTPGKRSGSVTPGR